MVSRHEGASPLKLLSQESRPPKPDNLLTSELFITRIRSKAGDYPDDTRIGDLRIPPPKIVTDADYTLNGFLRDYTPPSKWRHFYNNELGSVERVMLSKVFDQAMRAGFDTIGSVRAANLSKFRESVAPGKKLPRISENAAKFLDVIFDPIPYKGVLVQKGEWVVFR